MKGRKRKPTSLKLVTGNPGNRPINISEPIPPGNLLDAPEWLTAAQKEGWKYAIDHAPLGLLKRLDRSVLTIWIISEDLHRQAAEKVAQFGMLTKAPETQLPMQSPFLPILNKQAQIMIKAAEHLGFSPTSRARLSFTSVGEPQISDPAERFFQNKKA